MKFSPQKWMDLKWNYRGPKGRGRESCIFLYVSSIRSKNLVKQHIFCKDAFFLTFSQQNLGVSRFVWCTQPNWTSDSLLVWRGLGRGTHRSAQMLFRFFSTTCDELTSRRCHLAASSSLYLSLARPKALVWIQRIQSLLRYFFMVFGVHVKKSHMLLNCTIEKIRTHYLFHHFCLFWLKMSRLFSFYKSGFFTS